MSAPWLTPNNDFEWDFSAPELNEKRWRQLRSNDPGLTSLEIRWGEGRRYFVNKIDWTKGGKCIGDNTHLKKLRVYVYDDLFGGEFGKCLVRKNYEAFCKALTSNVCIEHFHILRGVVGDQLCDFLEHNPSLRFLHIDGKFTDHESAQRLVSALSRRRDKSSLRRLAIEDDETCTEATGGLVAALHRQTKLEELRLISCNKSEDGWMHQSCWEALVDLLQDPNSCLAVLRLEGRESIAGDDVANALSTALAVNRSLKKFRLQGDSRRMDDEAPSGLTRIGWNGLLSSLGSNPVLEEIHLGSSNIGNEGAELLARAMRNLTSLTALHLNDCEEICSAGWRAFFNHLHGSTPYPLETLDIGCNNIDDEGIASFGDALSNFNSLKTVQLRKNLSITSVGWQSFGNHMRDLSALEWLGIAQNTVGESGAFAIGTSLTNSTATLKMLDLDHVVTGSGEAWEALLAFVRDSLSLEALTLQRCDIGDDGLQAVSDSFANNHSLKRLNLSGYDNRNDVPVFSEGWLFASTWLRNLSSLEELKLCDNLIDGPAAEALANAFQSLTSLKYLCLNGNYEISTVGWQAIARILRNNSSLVKLEMGGTRVPRSAIGEFALSLANNTTLKRVLFVIPIRPIVHNAFAPVLCNQASIASIQASNHTLESVGSLSFAYNHRCVECLSLNQNDNKNEVIRDKLFRYYFQKGNANMQDFVNIDLKIMPHAVGAMARDCKNFDAGQSVLFQLVKNIPTLVPPSRGKEYVGTKRKRLGWLGRGTHHDRYRFMRWR